MSASARTTDGPRSIIILGTGGNCIDILDAILEINDAAERRVYDCVGFLDDNQDNWGREFLGVRVLGPLSSAAQYTDARFVNGIGSEHNFWRKDAIIANAKVPPDRFESIVHPTASVSRSATVGRGTVILQNATVASNAVLGDHVMVLPNTVISHDDVIGDYSCITGGVCISGGVRVGRSCYLGTNSAIRGNLTIGDECLIGMGSVVVRDVDANSVIVGSPGRFLRNTR